MNANDSLRYTTDAVNNTAIELGLLPLDGSVAACVVEYGMEALIECTLAIDQYVVIDAVLRGRMYARAIERISEHIVASCSKAAMV